MYMYIYFVMLCRGWISIIECQSSQTPIRSSCGSACGRIRECQTPIRCFHEWVCQVYSVYLLFLVQKYRY